VTRIGIVGAVIIIVVAAIFFGFRKAAREHARDRAPVAAAGTRTAPGSATASESATGSGSRPVPAPARIRQIDGKTRQQLAAQIASARAKRGERASEAAPEDLPKDYIRDQVRALIPLLSECYTHALETDPKIAGKLVVDFAIGGEPAIGGIVEESDVDPAQSTITDAGMIECVRETMYGAEFIAPSEGGRVVVHYPFEFSNAPADN
jgi:hypothetical protein